MTPRVRLFADRDYAAFVRIRRLARARVGQAHGCREVHTRAANVAVVELNAALGYAIVGSRGAYELAIR